MKNVILNDCMNAIRNTCLGDLIKSEVINTLCKKNVLYHIDVLYSNGIGEHRFNSVIEKAFPKYAKRVMMFQRNELSNPYSNDNRQNKNRVYIGPYGLIPLSEHSFVFVVKPSVTFQKLQKGCTFELDLSHSQIQDDTPYAKRNSVQASIISFYFVGPSASAWYQRVFKLFYKSIPNTSIGKNEVALTQLNITEETSIYTRRFVDTMDSLIFDRKEELLQLINRYIKGLNSLRKLGGKPTRGILLYGPPGTGKTSFVLSYAKMMNFRLIEITTSASLYQESSQTRPQRSLHINTGEVNNIIGTRLSGDCKFVVVLIDEIDRIIDETGTKSLLKMIDGFPSGTIVIATTNHIDKLEPAILRAGRFDYKVELCEYDLNGALALCDFYNIDHPIEFLQKQFPEMNDSSDSEYKICPADLKLRIMDYLLDSIVKQ